MMGYMGIFLILSAVNVLIIGGCLWVDVSEFCGIEDISPLGYITYFVLSEMFILLAVSGIYCMQH